MIYFSFVGSHDDPSVNPEGGALLNIFGKYKGDIDRVYLIATVSRGSTDFRPIAEKNVDLIRGQKAEVGCEIIAMQVANPIDFEIIYPSILDLVLEIMDRDKLKGEAKVINITSGTPTMTACWVLLQNSGLIPNATLVQSFEKRFALPNGETTREVNLEIDDFPEIVAPSALKRQLTIAQRRNRALQDELRGKDLDTRVAELIGSSKQIREIKEQLLKDVSSDTHVLIMGERGTGKGVVAEAIWRLHRKKADDKLTTFDCGAFQKDLVVAELFGYKKGAFTGADSDHEGIVRSCANRILFLDEIGNLTLNGQQSLMRLLTHGELKRVGSNRVETISVQIIGATNKDVEDPTLFAPDLKDRFHEVVFLPALRERPEDIRLLIDHFLPIYSKREGVTSPLILRKDLLEKLRSYRWPGNVRELENWIQRVARRFREGGEISLADLPKKFVGDVLAKGEDDLVLPPLPLTVPLEDFVEAIREKARSLAHGNMSEVDRLLSQTVGTEKQRQYRQGKKRKRVREQY